MGTVAEASDMRTSGGHCYLELIEKNEVTGAVTARIRAIIWASQFNGLQMKFAAVTGQRMSTGMKLLVRGTVNFHSAYGMSLVITDVDPSFTVGDVERRRREILQRLTREGIAEMNKRLPWPVLTLRIAVISARERLTTATSCISSTPTHSVCDSESDCLRPSCRANTPPPR